MKKKKPLTDKQFNELLKKLDVEVKHFRETKIPRCQTCHANMKKVDKYTWKTICGHSPNLRISIG